MLPYSQRIYKFFKQPKFYLCGSRKLGEIFIFILQFLPRLFFLKSFWTTLINLSLFRLSKSLFGPRAAPSTPRRRSNTLTGGDRAVPRTPTAASPTWPAWERSAPQAKTAARAARIWIYRSWPSSMMNRKRLIALDLTLLSSHVRKALLN